MNLTIPEFYKNKSVLITGGSGFIGKVLLEKLLRSCPDVKKIYLLMRSKKGKTPEERIKTITDLPLFDVLLRSESNLSSSEEILNKIQLISGDCSQLSLGLNPSDRQLLINEINVIFHGAASVRFDDPLNESILLNTRGTREISQLALEIKNLSCFVHISTTYCNTDRQVIGEGLYPAHADWRKTIEIVENCDHSTLNILTQKFISPLPNTYTFAKSLAEHVVYDLCAEKLPVVIFRPSIVISTDREPFAGWIDNFNGPIGMMVASGKGVVRTVYGNPDIIADYVPVDLVVKALLISSWKKGVEKKDDKNPITFYNASSNGYKPTTMGDIIEMGHDFLSKMSLNNIFWYPDGGVTKCYPLHMLKMYFYQILPALLVDGLLKLTGHKPLLLKIQRRIYIANMALAYFLTNQWQFINDNTINLENSLLEQDLEQFSYKKEALDQWQYFLNASLGARKYLLKEDDASIPQANLHAKRMWVISKVFNIFWYLTIVWIIWKINTLGFLLNRWNGFIHYLASPL